MQKGLYCTIWDLDCVPAMLVLHSMAPSIVPPLQYIFFSEIYFGKAWQRQLVEAGLHWSVFHLWARFLGSLCTFPVGYCNCALLVVAMYTTNTTNTSHHRSKAWLGCVSECDQRVSLFSLQQCSDAWTKCDACKSEIRYLFSICFAIAGMEYYTEWVSRSILLPTLLTPHSLTQIRLLRHFFSLSVSQLGKL